MYKSTDMYIINTLGRIDRRAYALIYSHWVVLLSTPEPEPEDMCMHRGHEHAQRTYACTEDMCMHRGHMHALH